jgi:predicted phage terminase large subunit-like protein
MPRTPEQWASFLQGKYLGIGVDPAASEKTHADYSVAALMAVDSLAPNANAWVLDIVRGQWAVPVFVARLAQLQRQWRARLVVEAVAGFKAVPQMLRHLDPSLVITEVRPTTDKFQRAQGLSAAWNAGKVFVPAGEGAGDWVDPLLAEVLSFSGVKDRQDDQVDALAHVWNALTAARPAIERGAVIASGGFG